VCADYSSVGCLSIEMVSTVATFSSLPATSPHSTPHPCSIPFHVPIRLISVSVFRGASVAPYFWKIWPATSLVRYHANGSYLPPVMLNDLVRLAFGHTTTLLLTPARTSSYHPSRSVHLMKVSTRRGLCRGVSVYF